jgi:hypothetical protein
MRPFTGAVPLQRAQPPPDASLPPAASAHGRDITSAAPYNRGLSGSALRVSSTSGPDTASAPPRPPRDDGPPPQTRVDHLVARLGAGLAPTPVFAASPSSHIARAFPSPVSGSGSRNPPGRPSDDALSVSITPNAQGQDSLYLVESISHPGVFTCHRCVSPPPRGGVVFHGARAEAATTRAPTLSV